MPKPSSNGATRSAAGSSPLLLTRRDFLRTSLGGAVLLGAGPAVLAACGGGAAPGVSPDEPFRIGFAYISPRDDNGWSTTHDIGRQTVEDHIENVESTWVDNVPLSAEGTQVFQNLASQNHMVVVNSEYADLLHSVVERNPDVMFLECNGNRFDLPNLRAYYVNHWKVAYCMGVAAGLLTESNRLGYVGAFPTATVYNDTNAFLLGAQSVNPDVELQVVMVYSFFDPPGASQATNALIDGGADVIFDVQDDVTPLQVCEERGVWSCIWNRDNRGFGPNAYVNAVALDWNEYYLEQAQSVLDGSFENNEEGPDLLDLAAGVDTTPWGQNVPTEVQEAGDAARAALLSGDLHVYEGPIVDAEGNERVAAGEHLDERQAYEVNWSVEGVQGVA